MTQFAPPPDALLNLDFGQWKQNVEDVVDRLDAIIDGLDSNPLAGIVFKAVGLDKALDQAKAIIDSIAAALDKIPG